MYKVLKGFRGSPDGIRVIEYVVGQTLTENTDFSRDLIEVALAEKWVTEVTEKPAKKVAAKKPRK